MVDQRAKNMFLTYFHEEGKWIFIFYDNDTCFGLNNEGLIAFGYNIEYHDKIGTLNVWNGESSVLWNNLEKCFPSEIEAMYKDIRTRGLLSYDLIMSVLNGEQSDKWCEAIYNADGRFKYIDPLIEEGNGSYLYAAQAPVSRTVSGGRITASFMSIASTRRAVSSRISRPCVSIRPGNGRRVPVGQHDDHPVRRSVYPCKVRFLHGGATYLQGRAGID